MAAPLAALLSVAGVPPFGGYASRWLLYLGSFLGAREVPLLSLYGLIAMAGAFNNSLHEYSREIGGALVPEMKISYVVPIKGTMLVLQ